MNQKIKSLFSDKKISFLAGALIFLMVVLAFVLFAFFPAVNQTNFLKDFYYQRVKPLVLEWLLSPVREPAKIIPADDQPLEKPALYRPVLEYEQAVIRVVEQTSPAIVSIIISKDLPILERCLYDPFGGFFDQEFQIYVPCPSPDRVERRQIGGGSGFIVSSDGLIITNRHVVSDRDAHYTVLTNDGRRYDARILAIDPAYDLAVIKIEASNLTTAVLGDSDTVKLGQTAIAIGNALGEFQNTVSVGVISGVGRSIRASDGRQQIYIEDAFQTDAAINQGNSGGPLLNLKGEVIGINTAVAIGAENIGFAIPINKLRGTIESFKATGRLIIPFLGVRHELTEEGARLVSGQNEPAVASGSPADKAGLREGDIILDINGHRIDRNNSLVSIVRRFNVGDVVNVRVKRGDNVFILRVTLVERPLN